MKALFMGLIGAMTLSSVAAADEYGIATYYYHPRYPYSMIAAHKSLPMGTRVRVHDLDNGRAVDVTIVDRGPFAGPNRIIDLSTVAASALGIRSCGIAHVRVERLGAGVQTAYSGYSAAAGSHTAYHGYRAAAAGLHTAYRGYRAAVWLHPAYRGYRTAAASGYALSRGRQRL